MKDGYDAQELAHEMRVCVCALITAHKREDWNGFWAAVEITKAALGQYILITDEEWAIFRDDTKRVKA